MLRPEHYTDLADMFRLMGDPTRLRILYTCIDAPTCVGDIARGLGLSAPLVSHHLRLLRGARIVRAERRGKRVYYTADDEHIRAVLADMGRHVREAGAGLKVA
ncbi:MAG: winged helix-turn-helix transcriptional regulator [Alphaproteobacteria bacterium]|nr:winged helix-turn-helix transcriptional regulator [Alphaproteobacteria bacterium]